MKCVSKYSAMNISVRGDIATSVSEVCNGDSECMKVMRAFSSEATKKMKELTARDLCEIDEKCRPEIVSGVGPSLLMDDCRKCKDILHYYGTDGRDRAGKILAQLFAITCKDLEISPKMCSSVSEEKAVKFIDMIGARMDESSICRGTGTCKNDAKTSRNWQ